VFDTTMHKQAVGLLQIENDLHRAVEREELSVHYQPIVSTRTGTIAGFEALVRWERPGQGFVPPADFIRIAEETGLIIPLGPGCWTGPAGRSAPGRSRPYRLERPSW
jgi:predicted signal transduction protein with EAL and GGDEF domain